jgi:uncharacterized protein (DUF983 family)
MTPAEAITVAQFHKPSGTICPQCGDDQLITRTGFGHVRRHCGQCDYRWTRCENLNHNCHRVPERTTS